MINVTVWNEHVQDKEDNVLAVYPDGINACIADFLGRNDDISVTCATLDMPECGLGNDVLENTDVLIWWGHVAHEKVPDEIVEKIHDRILRGMGLIVLHSGHFSKILRKTLGTTCSLKWREGDRERVWNIAPNHPITQGLGEYFYLEHEEMYGERFDVPDPDELVLIGCSAAERFSVPAAYGTEDSERCSISSRVMKPIRHSRIRMFRLLLRTP